MHRHMLPHVNKQNRAGLKHQTTIYSKHTALALQNDRYAAHSAHSADVQVGPHVWVLGGAGHQLGKG